MTCNTNCEVLFSFFFYFIFFTFRGLLYGTLWKFFGLSVKRRSPRKLLPEGCQNKVPWEKAIFFLTQLQSTILKITDRTAQKAISLGFVCQSHRVQRSLRKDCHVASSWLYDGAKTDQTYCSVLLVHMPRLDDHICFYCHSSHLPRGNAMSSQSHIFSTDSNFPFSILENSNVAVAHFLSSSSFLFLCIFIY